MPIIMTLKRFREMPFEDIATKSEREQERILSQIRKSFIRQAKALNKKSDDYYSHALDRYLDTYGRKWNRERNPTAKNVIGFERYDVINDRVIVTNYDLTNYQDPRTMSKNQIMQELAAYHAFFTSQSSTIPGIKKLNKETAKRLFGTNDKGKILGSMTLRESQKYWALYQELQNTPEMQSFFNSNYGSNPIQWKVLEVYNEYGNKFANADFSTLVDAALKKFDIIRAAYAADEDYSWQENKML